MSSREVVIPVESGINLVITGARRSSRDLIYGINVFEERKGQNGEKERIRLVENGKAHLCGYTGWTLESRLASALVGPRGEKLKEHLERHNGL